MFLSPRNARRVAKKAVEKAADQINAGLAAGQRSITVPVGITEALETALNAAGGWRAEIKKMTDEHGILFAHEDETVQRTDPNCPIHSLETVRKKSVVEVAKAAEQINEALENGHRGVFSIAPGIADQVIRGLEQGDEDGGWKVTVKSRDDLAVKFTVSETTAESGAQAATN